MSRFDQFSDEELMALMDVLMLTSLKGEGNETITALMVEIDATLVSRTPNFKLG